MPVQLVATLVSGALMAVNVASARVQLRFHRRGEVQLHPLQLAATLADAGAAFGFFAAADGCPFRGINLGLRSQPFYPAPPSG